jgi:hypothetical protein
MRFKAFFGCIKKDAEIRRTDVESSKYYNPPYYSRDALLAPNQEIKWHHFDFITYDFMHMMLPQPEIFEIKQVLSIQKSKIEQRQDLMLSMIRDRISNAEKFEKEHSSKFSYGRKKRSLYDVCSQQGLGNYRERARRRMKGCNHREDLEIITALYQARYYGGDEFQMYEPERLTRSRSTSYRSRSRSKVESSI